MLEKYFALNWSLIPVSENKRPAVPWKKYQSTRANISQVKSWLNQGFGIGLVTGKISGIVVVDDDRTKHGLNEWGFSSPLEVKTQSGGKHYYYAYEPNMGNTSNHDLHIDIRGDGGYVILPPTNGYEWQTFADFVDLKPLDPNLKELLYRSDKRGERVNLTESVGISQGGRDDSLLRLANSLCNHYPKDTWEDEVLPLLAKVNETYNPPLAEVDVLKIYTQATNFVSSRPKSTDAAVAPLSFSQIVDDRIEEREMEQGAPSTGFKGLDDFIKGFLPGHVYTTTGDTNVGKTALCANFALNVASQDRRVLYLALEPDRSIVDYLASIFNRKRYDDLTQDDLKANFGPIFFYGKEHVRTLDSLVKTLQDNERFDLVIVDHVGYFVSGGNNTTQQQADAMKVIASIAKQKRCAIILIQHPRKRSKTNRDEPLSEFDISGSAAFIQDATDVLIVERNRKIDEETGHFEYLDTGYIKVMKSKSGKNGVCSINFHQDKALITERSAYEF